MTELSIPMWQRASDIRTLAIEGCELGLTVGWLYPQDAATYFILGTGVHYSVEQAILYGLSLEEAIAEGWLSCQREIAKAQADGVEIIKANRSKRTLETMESDLSILVRNWFDTVPPGAEDRFPILDDYDWPPIVEHKIWLPKENLYTTVDAIFQGGPKGGEVAIVDWKSGSKSYAPPSQLHTYRFGGVREGWFPKEQKFVGFFVHLNAGKVQLVNEYIGDAVVTSWLHAAELRKKEIVQARRLPLALDSYNCQNTNVNKKNCPTCGDGNVVELLGRIAQAELETEPAEKKSEITQPDLPGPW